MAFGGSVMFWSVILQGFTSLAIWVLSLLPEGGCEEIVAFDTINVGWAAPWMDWAVFTAAFLVVVTMEIMLATYRLTEWVRIWVKL